jgi:CTP:molybdopterin cytidylyltransferase MocA
VTETRPPFVGLLLAAGAGRRLGRPKALIELDRAPAVVTQVRRLDAAGAAATTVVLGAAAEQAAPLLEGVPGVDIVVADDWDEGMGASLRAGLTALADAPEHVDAVLVTLVDLPDVTAEVMQRVLGSWTSRGARRDDLLRASYAGRPGHPVLLGRDHWAPLVSSLGGDVGARTYLAERRVHDVSCEDLATGRDIDRPDDLPGARA